MEYRKLLNILKERYGIEYDLNPWINTCHIYSCSRAYAYININVHQINNECLESLHREATNDDINAAILHEAGHYIHFARFKLDTLKKKPSKVKTLLWELQANKYAELIAYDLNIPLRHEILRSFLQRYINNRLTKKFKKTLDKLVNNVYTNLIVKE